MKTALKKVGLGCLFLCVCLVSACATKNEQAVSAKSSNKPVDENKQIIDYNKADKDYRALITKFESERHQASDFDQIIRVYPLTSKYSPYNNLEQANKLLALNSMDEKNWKTCLHATEAMLTENYTSLTGHYGAMVCHFETGQSARSDYHKTMLDGFMQAVWRSGDGKLPESAFYITSANDLYAFVQLNGMVAKGQSLIYHEKRPMNAIKVENPETQQESIWYFDVTAQFRRGILDELENQE